MRSSPDPKESDSSGGSFVVPDEPGWSTADWLIAAMLFAAVFIAYHPVWAAGFVWDDKGHVTRPDLQSLHGLWRIWCEPGATQQYYPLLHSAFWLEHRMWGDAAEAYHLANIALHAAASVFLYAVLRRLSLPGATFAAFVFALHPVCVESVAWISEQKNTLSAVFFFCATLAYFRFEDQRRAGAYILATLLFAMAIMTKTVTATLPAALLVVAWWRHGRISPKRDLVPLLPWFGLAALAGVVTAWVEGKYIGASGTSFSLGVADRFAVAGHAIWFYMAKVFWPTNLAFIYPHWDIATEGPAKFLYPAAFAALVAVLFALRGRARGPLAAVLLFSGTLFPALGFINVYPFIYSYVADHFQYLALAIMVSAAAAACSLGTRTLGAKSRILDACIAASLVAVLFRMTSALSRDYRDAQTLWTATLAKNPGCWMAYQNLGGIQLGEGKTTEAISDFTKAVALNPTNHEALNELGVAQLQEGRVDEAEATLRKALVVDPNSTETHLNLGVALLENDKTREAVPHLRGVLEVDPTNTKALRALANALFEQNQPKEAEALYTRFFERDPNNAEVHSDYGTVLEIVGHHQEAIDEFNKSLALNPHQVWTLQNLARSYVHLGQFDNAAYTFERACVEDPTSAPLRDVAGVMLLRSGHLEEAATQFRQALTIDPHLVDALGHMGYYYYKNKRLDEAADCFRRAIAIKPDSGPLHSALGSILADAGHVQEATEQLNRALALNPRDSQAQKKLDALASPQRP